TTKIVHYQNGIYSSETLAYEDVSTIPADSGFRNFGNITTRTVYANANGTGSWLLQTKYCSDTACTVPGYYHPQSYLNRNLIRLPQTVETVDPSYGVLAKTSYGYDGYSTPGNGRNGLDSSMGSVRGNPTTTTAYELTGQNRQLVTTTQYFNTGDVRLV